MDPRTRTRNISLVTASDPEYRRYVERQRLATSRIGEGYGQRLYADKISVLLESAVRKWVAPYGGQENRILTFEQLGRDHKYSKRFREIDFVLDREDTLTIGELKVSSSLKVLTKAYAQLSESFDVLQRTGRSVEPMLIYINLNYENSRVDIDTFDPDFGSMVFQHRNVNGRAYQLLQLSPIEIFDWAVEQGIIRDPKLIEKALEEARQNHFLRTERSKLRQMEVPEDEWPTELKVIDMQRAPMIVQFCSTDNRPDKNDLATRLKDAFSERHEQRFNFGRIKWFDNTKFFGNVRIHGEEVAFVHINNFKRKPSGPLDKNQVIYYRRVVRSDTGKIRLSGCTLLEYTPDFGTLMHLLEHDAIEGCVAIRKPSKMPVESKYIFRLLEHGTRQIFMNRSEASFIETVQNYYDKGLRDRWFHRLCWYLERIAMKVVESKNREMMEQMIYCYFYANLRPGILFYVWQHGLFRFIAYSDGMDYEIPMEILLQHADDLDELELDRIRNYSYANSFFPKLKAQDSL